MFGSKRMFVVYGWAMTAALLAACGAAAAPTPSRFKACRRWIPVRSLALIVASRRIPAICNLGARPGAIKPLPVVARSSRSSGARIGL